MNIGIDILCESERLVINDKFRAFIKALSVATNPAVDSATRARAFALLAWICKVAHEYSPLDDDDSGMFYVRRALELDPQCIDAHVECILQYKGKLIGPGHIDHHAFASSVAQLLTLKHNHNIKLEEDVIDAIALHTNQVPL